MTVKEKLDMFVGQRVTVHDRFATVVGILEHNEYNGEYGILEDIAVVGFYPADCEWVDSMQRRIRLNQ